MTGLQVLGGLLVATGLLDVFLSVLAYDIPGLFTPRLYSAVWRVFRAAANRLPSSAGHLVRSLAAPVMVTVSILVWAALQVLGFALLYYPDVRSPGFQLSSVGHSFGGALYVSAAALSSVSATGGESAAHFPHPLLPLEALIGLSLLTLALTYILGLYGVVQRASVAWVVLQQLAGRERSAPHAPLSPFLSGGSRDDFSMLWQELHESLVSYLEGMRRYPAAFYFHTRTRRRSLPSMFWFIAETAAPVRYATPDGAAERDNPWLRGLLVCLLDAIPEIAQRCTTKPPPDGTSHELVSRQEFQAMMSSRAGPAGPKEFLDLVATLGTLVPRWQDMSIEEPYARYVDWAEFTDTTRGLVRRLSVEFGVPFDPTPPPLDS